MTADLLALLENIHPTLGKLTGIPLLVFVIVAGLTCLFLIGYLIQGPRVGWQLLTAVRGVRRLKRGAPPEEVAAVLKREPLQHLWAEYSDTLHELRKAGSGVSAITEVRATMPAEMFFTKDVLVDSRLFDDFTRHLPGVLTGLGIIGTFAGLLEGLAKFDASSTATAVAGLKPLLDGVSHAFIASAVAIACAMAVTFGSRLILAFFYRRVERLNQSIDALYATGAGEEYLGRLVTASEKAEAHTAQLKQALVEDLTTMMTNLVERQIAAQAETSRALGAHIGDAITGQLAAPLQRMTEAMETSSKGNTQAVSGMLESMLAGFMQRLEDTFGGQMRGIHEQMDRSMAAMSTVQQALQKLVEDVNRSNAQAASRMSVTLEDAMKRSAANQQMLTDQMREFVQDFRRLVTEEQDKAKRSMEQAVDRVLEQLSSALSNMETVRAQAASAERARSVELSNHAQNLVGGLSDGVDGLLKTVAEHVAATQRNIEAIGAVTTRAIDGMNNGALVMGSAAKSFEGAGNAVSGVFERSAQVADQMSSTATVLQAAATAVRQGFDQYEQTRRTVDANVQALSQLIDATKREAGLSKAMIADLDRIVAQLRNAEERTKTYLDQVNGALEEAFQRFGDSLLTSVKRSIAETDRHLSSGVQQLNGVVQEIGAAVSRMRKG